MSSLSDCLAFLWRESTIQVSPHGFWTLNCFNLSTVRTASLAAFKKVVSHPIFALNLIVYGRKMWGRSFFEGLKFLPASYGHDDPQANF